MITKRYLSSPAFNGESLTKLSDIERQYPGEQVRFAAAGAAEEAESATTFLASAGLAPPAGETRGLPRGILLDIGGMVRLRAWEAAGLDAHRRAGLMTADEALEHIIDVLTRAAADPAELARAGALGRAVFDLRMSRFAWAGPMEYQADIALDTPDEEALIDALAKFLWGSRPGSS
jgi:hypothetical protein